MFTIATGTRRNGFSDEDNFESIDEARAYIQRWLPAHKCDRGDWVCGLSDRRTRFSESVDCEFVDDGWNELLAIYEEYLNEVCQE